MIRYYFSNPTLRWIAGLFATAAAFLLAAAWMFNSGDPDHAINAYLPIIVGMAVLAIALAQSVLWALNRVQPPSGA
jgi:hypothetical protein